MKAKIAYTTSVVKQSGVLVKQGEDSECLCKTTVVYLCDLLYGSLDCFLLFYLAGTVLV